MSSGVRPPRQPYHHGDLRNALVDAAVALAREGGPKAVVLREAARRVDVSPTAAYRHFDALPELVNAVRLRCLGALATAMQAELRRLDRIGDPVHDAIAHLHAVGRGYVHFALAEPGLFATAFSRDETSPPRRTAEEAPDSPWSLLTDALDNLVSARVLAPGSREAAATHAWATVHGLSLLLLGPMAQTPAQARAPMIEATLGMVVDGLRSR